MEYGIPLMIVVSIGLLAGIILTAAAKFMAVKENETAKQIEEVLPGANCGACGYAGCADYASALANDPTLPTNACTPGGNSVAQAISEALGMEFEAVASKVVVLACSGTLDQTSYAMDYVGYQSCEASKLFFRGRGSCEMACMGFGDCIKVCDYDALRIENGIVTVNRYKCVGCGACTKVCPSKLLEVIPEDKRYVVACSTRNKAKDTVKVCKIGCIACSKCVQACKFDAVHLVGNCAKIDYELCKNCGACEKACPRHVIRSFPKM